MLQKVQRDLMIPPLALDEVMGVPGWVVDSSTGNPMTVDSYFSSNLLPTQSDCNDCRERNVEVRVVQSWPIVVPKIRECPH